jgi:hypothetical protein
MSSPSFGAEFGRPGNSFQDWPIATRSLVREQPTTLRWRQIDSPTDAR